MRGKPDDKGIYQEYMNGGNQHLIWAKSHSLSNLVTDNLA